MVACVDGHHFIEAIQVRQPHGCTRLDHLTVGAWMNDVVIAGESEVAHQAHGLGQFVIVRSDGATFHGIEGLGGVEAEDFALSKAAYVLTAFNYEKGNNYGVELTAKYTNGHLSAYNNISYARQIATNVVSNQYLFGADELAFIANNYVYTDHSQWISGSAGASYKWDEGTRLSMDLLYGSGLRSGFANTASLPFYSQVNLGVSHEFKWFNDLKPTTLRVDVVNLFDTSYVIRDGSGIGVFAPQFGPRRGFFFGISQKL